MKEKIEATVVEILPNNQYSIELENGTILRAYMAGKMVFNKIRVILGDKVVVELDPLGGKSTNRIIRRQDKK